MASKQLAILATFLAVALASKDAVPIIERDHDALCKVYTVVESPTVVNTCFATNTVHKIEHCTEITITDAPTCLTTTLTITTTVTEPETTHSAPFLTMPNPFPPASSHSAQMPHTSNSTDIGSVPSSSVPGPIQSTASEVYQTWVDPILSSSIADTPPQSSADVEPPVVSSYIPQSTPVVEPPAPSTTVDAPTPTPTAVSPEGICGGTSGYTCQDSVFGNCCSASGYCGHSAEYCGNGCQSTFGYCTDISNDGTCGNGVTCVGGVFGNCCSEFYFCGSGSDFCGTGCRPEFGECGTPVVSSIAAYPTYD